MKIRQLNSRIISETEQHDLCVSVPAALTMRQLRYGHPCKKAEADEKEEGERAAETSSQQVEEEGAEGGADLEKALD